MNQVTKIFEYLGGLVAVLLVAGGAVVVFGVPGGLAVLFVGALAGWAVFAYFHYRHIRPQELLPLLATAAGAGSPIEPALWAYLDDRPTGGARELWLAVLMSV